MGSGIGFVRTPGDVNNDYHNAPRRQLIVNLEQGEIHRTVKDGRAGATSTTTKEFRPGECCYVEDVEGTGHVTRNIQSTIVFIPVDGQEALGKGALIED